MPKVYDEDGIQKKAKYRVTIGNTDHPESDSDSGSESAQIVVSASTMEVEPSSDERMHLDEEEAAAEVEVDTTGMEHGLLSILSVQQDCHNDIMKKSIDLRYPMALENDFSVQCCLCLDEGCQKTLAVYEVLECHGENCVKSGRGGALTWFCEKCALDIDLRKAFANQRGATVKRNMVCQCHANSHVTVKTYAVTKAGENQVERFFLLSRETQSSLVLDGNMFFNSKPSLAELVENPDSLKIHAKKCLKKTDDGLFQVRTTFNDAAIKGTSEASKQKQKVSVQIIYDNVTESVRLLATAPTTSVHVTPSNVVKTKGGTGGTRGGGGAPAAKPGTSSDGVEREMSDKNGEGVVSYVFPMKNLPGESAGIEVVCDGVIAGGSNEIMPLMQKLEREDLLDTVPSFCPIPRLDSMSTNVCFEEGEYLLACSHTRHSAK